MTTTESDIFEKLSGSAENPERVLEIAIDHFQSSRNAVEMFESMKMLTRHQLGLPLIPSETDPTNSEDVERKLESGLLDACRVAGQMLIEDGQIGQGWMYLRPLADIDLAKRLLSKLPINDDNYDEMIQVLLHEGVDVGRGYEAVLKHQGTCNSITLFEQSIAGRPLADRKAAAAKLLDHFHRELAEMIRDDISRRDTSNPTAVNEDGSPQTLGQMVETRKWLLDEGGYHLDTTHLSSTVRIASVLDQRDHWVKAKELTAYGRRLNQQFQYPGDEPFVDFYPAYSAFYDVLLGDRIEAGLKLFERKARTVDSGEHGSAAIETYVDLLDRIGRHDEAIQAAISLIPSDISSQQIMPLLTEIAKRSLSSESFDRIAQFCKQHNDLLGFAAVLHAKQSMTH